MTKQLTLSLLLLTVSVWAKDGLPDPNPLFQAPKTENKQAESRIKELGGHILIDSRAEITQSLQTDNRFEPVGISTPTSTPPTNHAYIWLNNTTKRICTKFDDNSSGCLSSGGGSGTITSVTAGNGLTGGGSSGAVTLTVDYSSVTAQGNTFNAANKLLLLNGSGIVPNTLLNGTYHILADTATLANALSYQVSLTTGVMGTLQAAQEPAHTGDVTNSAGSLTLSASNTQPNITTLAASSVTVKGAQGLGVTFGLKTGSATVTNLGTNSTVCTDGNSQLTTSGCSASGGSVNNGNGSQIGYYSSGGTTISGSSFIQVNTSSVTVSTTTTFSGLTVKNIGNGSAATDAAAYGQLAYFQVVTSTSTTSSTNNTNSYTAATNQAVTISPTNSSHHIKVTACTQADNAASGVNVIFTIKQGSVDLSGSQTNGLGFMTGPGEVAMPLCFSAVDKPGTTSAVTYQVYFKNNNNSTTVSCGRNDAQQTIIAEEIP